MLFFWYLHDLPDKKANGGEEGCEIGKECRGSSRSEVQWSYPEDATADNEPATPAAPLTLVAFAYAKAACKLINYSQLMKEDAKCD